MPKDDPRQRFELLALSHLATAYNLARWLTGSAADAKDVAREAAATIVGIELMHMIRNGRLKAPGRLCLAQQFLSLMS